MSAKPRLLLVDDNDRLRRAVGRLLERHFEVAPAASKAEALALLDGGPAFDVMLTDLEMPGGSGDDLLAAVADRGDPLHRRAVVWTGSELDAERRASFAERGIPLLSKGLASAQIVQFLLGRLA
ncbi:MAG: response regulator [Myxococcales bacterium]|nr:response regulator [Myxococcales bacterium]